LQVTIVTEDNRISTVDLHSMSVTDVRKFYGPRLGITDRAVAVLNDRDISSKIEAQTIVSNYDRLAFLTQKGLLRY